MNDIIKLNVGGQPFVTTRATLCAEDNSMLSKMFDPGSAFGPPARTDDGSIFLDRSPVVFGHILEYLRNGCKLIYDPPRDHIKLLRADADYFGLFGLKEECDAIIAAIDDIVKLNVGGRLFETTRSTLQAQNDSILAAMFDPRHNSSSAMTDVAHRLPVKNTADDGSIFLDRNPVTFEYVLDYLRNGCGELVNDPPVEHLRLLKADADYFGLYDLKQKCTFRIKERENGCAEPHRQYCVADDYDLFAMLAKRKECRVEHVIPAVTVEGQLAKQTRYIVSWRAR